MNSSFSGRDEGNVRLLKNRKKKLRHSVLPPETFFLYSEEFKIAHYQALGTDNYKRSPFGEQKKTFQAGETVVQNL